MNVRQIIKKTPIIRDLARVAYRWSQFFQTFSGSRDYWENRYRTGRNSGAGSYDRLAEFKAEVLNRFVHENSVSIVIEFGCGDGNQLGLSEYPRYFGYDVSKVAIDMCRQKFKSDRTKTFEVIGESECEVGDLSLSLDVIYHLVEDDVFNEYMVRLFEASNKFVIIYSSNDQNFNDRWPSPHVRHRKFSTWIDDNAGDWVLMEHIENRYPYSEADTENTSFADFYVYKKTGE